MSIKKLTPRRKDAKEYKIQGIASRGGAFSPGVRRIRLAAI
jgi:hypothetical protein